MSEPIMSHNSEEYLACLLQSGARAYAAYASGELLEMHPEASEGFGPDPFTAWRGWLAVRVDELATAVAEKEPDLFTSQVRWAKSALAACGRDIPMRDVTVGIDGEVHDEG